MKPKRRMAILRALAATMLLGMCLGTAAPILAQASEGEETGYPSYEATLTPAKGGASSIVTMTFDDGLVETARFLSECGKIYGVRSSLMLIANNYRNESKAKVISDLLAEGYLSVESHSMTHMVLASNSWAEANKTSSPNVLENNTPANYQSEMTDARTLLEEVFGGDVLTYAPSNNTLPDDPVAWEYVKNSYYAVRSGAPRVQDIGIQPLDPASGNGKHSWHALTMTQLKGHSVEALCAYVDRAIEEQGWFITFAHGIVEKNSEMAPEDAKAFFAYIGEMQNAGKTWSATFTEATKYVRERQNSTVREYQNENGLFVELTMRETTEDGLPLSADIFNYPLTVKAEVPADWRGLLYTQGDVTASAPIFEESGRRYAYIDLVPNGGVATLLPHSLTSGSCELGDAFSVGGTAGETLIVSGARDLGFSGGTRSLVKLSLADYSEGAVYFGFALDGEADSLRVYGVADKDAASDWDAHTVNLNNAPALGRTGALVREDATFESTPFEILPTRTAGVYALDLSRYASYMKALGGDSLTLVFADSERSLSITPVSGEEILLQKELSRIDFNDLTALVSRGSREVNGILGSYVTNGCDAGTKFSLESDGAGGKLFRFVPNQTYNRLRFYNIFDHNLTEEDLGRTVVISFRVKSDRAGRFTYGLQSRMPRNGASGYTLAPGETADKKNYQGEFHYQNVGVVTDADVGKWRTYTMTVTVDETMLPKLVHDKNDTANPESYVEIAVALLAFTPSSDLLGAEMLIDDIIVREPNAAVSEGAATPFRKTLDFEGVSTTGILSGGLEYARYSESDAQKVQIDFARLSANAAHGGESGIEIVSHKNHNRHKFTGLWEAVPTIGETYRISFYMKADRTGRMNICLTGNNSTTLSDGVTPNTYRYTPYGSYFYCEVSEANVWRRYTIDVTIDAGMLTNEITHLCFMPSFGQNVTYDSTKASDFHLIVAGSDDPVTVYLDDICSQKVIAGETSVLPVEASASVSDTACTQDALTVSPPAFASAPAVSTYLVYKTAGLRDIGRALLSFDAAIAGEQTVLLYALTNTEADGQSMPGLDASGDIIPADILGGAPYARIKLTGPGTYTVDVTSYLRAIEGKDALFLLLCRESGGELSARLDFSIPFTEGLDFTGEASAEGGVLRAEPGVLSLLHLFGERDGVISRDVTYALSTIVTASADTSLTLAFSNGERRVGEQTYALKAGEQTALSFSYTADAEDVLSGLDRLVITADTPYTISSLLLERQTAVHIAGTPSLSLDAVYPAHEHLYGGVCDASCNICGGLREVSAAHVGGEATCADPAVCTVCGSSYGDPLGHSGGQASCTSRADCAICGTPYGETLPHTYTERHAAEQTLAKRATCTNPATYYLSCACGAQGEQTFPAGDPLGHNGVGATCSKQAVCTRCAARVGETLPHSYKLGECTVCRARDPEYVDGITPFREALAAAERAVGVQNRYVSLASAIRAYRALCEEERAVVTAERAVLEGLLAAYNQGAEEANTAHAAIVKEALGAKKGGTSVEGAALSIPRKDKDKQDKQDKQNKEEENDA